MKILHVMAGSPHGGAETACIDMVLAMHEAGETVALATRKNPRNERLINAGIPVYTLPFGGKIDIYTPRAMAKIIKNFKPGIVQGWMSRAPSKTPRWKPAMKIPRYLTVSRLGGYYSLKYFKTTDYFTTITPDIKNHLVSHGIEEHKVRHINNFAETETAEQPADRSAYNIPQDATLLLGLGRLHTAKAFDILIKAIKNLPDIYLWIAGEGPERQNLEQLITDLNMQDRVKLLGWRNDRAALFQASDICVFCSRYEPFGTVFVQAWAQKTPLIASNADGPRQFVHDQEDGLIAEIDNVEALKSDIQTLAADKELQNKLVENGYKRYLNEFTKNASVKAYLNFYKEIRNREELE